MLLLDRDGVVVGDPYNFESNHPKHIKRPEDMKIIPQIAELINAEGGAIASNQQGIKWGYKSLDEMVSEMRYLMGSIPGLRLCLFCPDDGQTCWAVDRYQFWRISDNFQLVEGQWRKPQPGMLKVLRVLFPEARAYIGDLSGLPWYGEGRDSDRQAALAANIPYMDVREFTQPLGNKQ